MLSDVESALGRETSCLILDLRRLTEIDSTGANALLELKTKLAKQGKELSLVLAEQTMAMKFLENFGVPSSIGDAYIFPDVDRAIERAEDSLLRTQPLRMYRDEIPLATVGLFAKFNPTGFGGNRAALATRILSGGQRNLSRRRSRQRTFRRYQGQR